MKHLEESTKTTPFGKFSVPRVPKHFIGRQKKKNSPVTFNIFYNTSVWSLDLF